MHIFNNFEFKNYAIFHEFWKYSHNKLKILNLKSSTKKYDSTKKMILNVKNNIHN